jgi:hypothetical protein
MSTQTPTFELRFDLLYRPAVAGGSGYRCEAYPLWLQTFTTHELRPRTPLTLLYRNADDTVEPRSVSLPLTTPSSELDVYAPLRDAGGYASFAAVGRQFIVGRVSRSSSLIFNAYCSTVAEDGNDVQARAGTTRVSMRVLLELLRRPGETRSFAVIQNTGNPPDAERSGERGPRKDSGALHKGSITLRHVRLYAASGAHASVDEFERQVLLPPQPAIDNETDEQRAGVAEAMRDLVIRSLTAFTNRHGPAVLPVPTKAFIGHFHVPEWRMSYLFAPSFPYLGYKSHRASRRSFFIEALRNSLRRCVLGVAQATEYGQSLLTNGARGQREHASARLLVMMITIYANMMPYLDDFVNENVASAPYSEQRIEITEDFKSARITNADDCEGTGCEPLLEVVELTERLEPAARDPTPLDNLLDLLAAVARCYVPCLSLHAVTNKKAVPAAHLDVDDDNVPAHTICVLIPYRQFERWAADELGGVSRLRSTRFYRSRAAAFESAPEKLPLLIVDGTARSDPSLLPLSEYFSAEERARGVYGRALAHLHDKCLFVDEVRRHCNGTRLTVELFSGEAELTEAHRTNTADVSDFYKYTVKVQTLATAELGMCDFAAVMRPHAGARNAESGRGTYGAYFNQFLLQSDEVRLVPYLRVTPTHMAMIDMLMASEEFVPPLCTTPLDTTKSGVLPLASPSVERRLRALVRGRSTSVVGGGGGDDNDESTILHPRTVVVSARAIDVGERELQALADVAASPGVTRVDVDFFRIADAVSGIGGPTDVVDVTFFY